MLVALACGAEASDIGKERASARLAEFRPGPNTSPEEFDSELSAMVDEARDSPDDGFVDAVEGFVDAAGAGEDQAAVARLEDMAAGCEDYDQIDTSL